MKIYMDAYLAKNLGDDLFVDILTKRYPQHNFIAISNGIKGYNKKNLKVLSNSYLFKILKKFQLEKYLANRCNLVVSIGGSMYMENNDSKRDFGLGKNKRYILGTNFGPYKTEEYYKNLYKVFKNAEDVCFREKYSYDLFKELPNVRLAPDIAFLTDTSNLKKTERKRAIISVISCDYKLGKEYTNAYEEKMVELIEFLTEKGYEICLMSFCKAEKDEEAIESISRKLNEETKSRIEKYYYNGNLEEALNVIADSSLVVGTRFHANILALLLEKPLVSVIYSDKTLHVLEDMGINPKTIDIRNIQNFDVKEITEEVLSKKYDIENQIDGAQKHFEKLDKKLNN